MTRDKGAETKSTEEIVLLVKQLNQTNQLKILNTIDAFLYSQQIQREKK